jgi:hypothetical protein
MLRNGITVFRKSRRISVGDEMRVMVHAQGTEEIVGSAIVRSKTYCRDGGCMIKLVAPDE